MVKRELQILQKISKSGGTFESLAHELMTSETQKNTIPLLIRSFYQKETTKCVVLERLR